MAVPNIAPKTVGKVAVEYLEFDPENPRLIEEGVRNPTDEDIIRALADTSDLSEVVQSIAANGYFDIEPMIGMKVGNKWRVLEGNRRLAAIRILQNPAMAKGTGVAVPETSPANKATLKEVSVYAVTSKDQAREYIGFKHINGPHRWDALAKARFAADWYAKEKGVTLDKIANRPRRQSRDGCPPCERHVRARSRRRTRASSNRGTLSGQEVCFLAPLYRPDAVRIWRLPWPSGRLAR